MLHEIMQDDDKNDVAKMRIMKKKTKKERTSARFFCFGQNFRTL